MFSRFETLFLKFLFLMATSVGFGFAQPAVSHAQFDVYETYSDDYWIDGGGVHDIDIYIWENGMDIWIDGQFHQQFFDNDIDYAKIWFYSFYDQIHVNVYGYSSRNFKLFFYGSDYADTIFNYSNIRMSVSAGDGNDEIAGGSGDDAISGDEGNDIISGGPGDDDLYGNDGDDDIWGDDGDDYIRGGEGFDEAWGGEGDDTIRGGTEADVLDGGPGNDTLIGHFHNSTFHKLPDFAVDTLIGGTGEDEFIGGVAFLYFVYQGYYYPIEIEYMPDFNNTEDTMKHYFYFLYIPNPPSD